MGSRTRVLVAEDSPTARARLVDALGSDPALEVVGIAGDGLRAVDLCRELRPDVITMDMMMPLMNGLDATRQVMRQCPTPILIVSASMNRGELFRTYDALAAGAVDVLEKPSGTEPDGVWERRLVSTVKLVSRIQVVTRTRQATEPVPEPVPMPEPLPTPLPTPRRPPATGGNPPYSAIAIGASTGGPAALVNVLGSLPDDFDLPVLFVLHIDTAFSPAFADWLGRQITRSVRHARHGQSLAATAGAVIMAPAGRHLRVHGGRLLLDDGPERHSCRPSVDSLFESMADEYGPAAVACLLTGMGCDGAAGLAAVRSRGGLTIAQDEASCVVYGMPREAALRGAVQHVLPLGAIGPALSALTRRRAAPGPITDMLSEERPS